MRLRSFTAPTVAEAMRQIRDTLGADAIIISEYCGGRGRGVQITAAIEPDAGGETGGARAEPSKANGAGGVTAADLDFIRRSLAYHEAPARLVEHLCRAAERVAAADRGLALAAALDMAFTFMPLSRLPGRRLMLVGPPGAGKTVSAAKLAAQAILQGCAVTIATTDTVRAGGAGQLAALAEIMERPLHVAESPAKLRGLIDETPPESLLLIDSPGTNPFAEGEMNDLRAFVSAGEIEPVAVIGAGGDAGESAEIAEQFGRLGARRVIVAKLDIARRLGAMLTAANGFLALSNVGISAFVGQGLEALTPVSLARILLRDPTQPDARAAFDKADPS